MRKLFLLLALSLVLFTGCKDDDESTIILPIPCYSGYWSEKILLDNNYTEMEVAEEYDWFAIEKVGKSDSKYAYRIALSANESAFSRTAIVMLKSGGNTCIMKVVQAGGYDWKRFAKLKISELYLNQYSTESNDLIFEGVGAYSSTVSFNGYGDAHAKIAVNMYFPHVDYKNTSQVVTDFVFTFPFKEDPLFAPHIEDAREACLNPYYIDLKDWGYTTKSNVNKNNLIVSVEDGNVIYTFNDFRIEGKDNTYYTLNGTATLEFIK